MTVFSECSYTLGNILSSAKQTLQTEAQAIQKLISKLDENFVIAVKILLNCQGHIIVSGIGKTGHIGRKIAATFSSIGIPAFFMHAAEAIHGDLGMFKKKDTLLAISYSGLGNEILVIANAVRNIGANLISITGNPESDLAKFSAAHLNVDIEQEACPLNLAPTTSTTAILALGDALAVACIECRKFTSGDFAQLHPGGILGTRLSTRAKHIMRSGKSLPIIKPELPLLKTLEIISKKGMGMAIVLDKESRPVGIFTDGDLRRLIANKVDICSLTMQQAMSPNPLCVDQNLLAKDVAKRMDQHRVNQILITDTQGLLVGALNMHDLMTANII